MEARAALSRPGSTLANQSPVKMDIASATSVTGQPPASVPSGCYVHTLGLTNPFFILKLFNCLQLLLTCMFSSFLTIFKHIAQ